MEQVPEPYELRFFELTQKVNRERQRRQLLSNLSSNKQNLHHVVENDLLINEKTMKEIMKNHVISTQNLNLGMRGLKVDQIEQAYSKQFVAIKKQLNSIEQAFLFWYQSVFGDEWRLIADILSYHPFTRGSLREPEEIRQYFFCFNEQRGHILSSKIQHDACRNLELPLLLNQRPPSLVSSIEQLQVSKHQKKEKPRHPYLKLALSSDPNGQIRITYLKPDEEEEKVSLLGKKRPRSEEESRDIAMARCDRNIQQYIVKQDQGQLEAMTDAVPCHD